jgi:hygromycin-B 4-O-kinase
MISDDIIPKQELIDLLEEIFPATINQVHFITKGVFSQAYSFSSRNQEFILRIGSSEEGFRKDQFAFENFTGPAIPVPPIFKIGLYKPDHFYCISKKSPGKRLQDLPVKEEISLIPELISTIDRLREIPVPGHTFFGTLNVSGKGQFQTWHDFISNFANWEILIHKGVKEIFWSFDQLYSTSFLDEAICEKCKSSILQLAKFCPEEKHYVHGDFGFGNILTDGKKITAVLDWAELLCGDFLVDIAALDYGRDSNLYSTLFRQYCELKKIPIPYFEERLRCYKIIMALKSMYLEANRNQRDWYEEEVEKLKKMGVV